ncbi:hypothetical protein AB4Z09_12415 [Rhodococcus sp. TAF43]|uniref:hypothetical protein n=1 Tax=Rhodococcus sp. TAF43 TaxID=3237483 RepID=UPI003F9E927B
MPTDFVPWQTIWKRHRRYAGDGTWDTILNALLAHADANGSDLSNYTNLFAEPADHALGRSRGGLGTEIHQLADGHGRPLVLLIGPGQACATPNVPDHDERVVGAPDRVWSSPSAVTGTDPDLCDLEAS